MYGVPLLDPSTYGEERVPWVNSLSVDDLSFIHMVVAGVVVALMIMKVGGEIAFDRFVGKVFRDSSINALIDGYLISRV